MKFIQKDEQGLSVGRGWGERICTLQEPLSLSATKRLLISVSLSSLEVLWAEALFLALTLGGRLCLLAEDVPSHTEQSKPTKTSCKL